MAMPQQDPRVYSDRLYDYESYLKIRMEYPTRRRRRVNSWFKLLPPIRLQYKMGLTLGVVVLVASLAAMAFLSADTARLAYAKQELNNSLGALTQSQEEAAGEGVEIENALYSGAVDTTAKVIYPGSTRYLVLTNIPQASGKRIVEELYPLSRRIIRLEP
jgi:hypothetical protein